MTIHIDDILKEYNNLQLRDYRNKIKSTGVSKYDYNLRKEVQPTDLSFSRNKALILAIVMLKRNKIEELLDGWYGNIFRSFIKYVENNNLQINTCNYLKYDNIEDCLNYSLITGITKNTTKKSLNMFKPQIVDKLFEVNGIQKRTITKKDNKPLVIDKLNTFTLAIFTEAFKPNSLALAELKRIIKSTESFSLEWSNTIFNTIKPSKAAYRYIYDNTDDADAEIFKHIIVVGEKSFNTPVDNYKRYYETEKIVITTTMDLSDINTHTLTKAALEAPTNSPIYNHIVGNLQGTKSNLLEYITNLTAIATELNF